jgi:hypothetical protein
MSDLDRYLAGTELFDCQGRVEHVLTLLVDGRVRIRRGAVTIVIDPTTGHVDPPGSVVPDHVLHAVGELAGHPVPTTSKRRHDHGGHR